MLKSPEVAPLVATIRPGGASKPFTLRTLSAMASRREASPTGGVYFVKPPRAAR